jgi:isoquinoline 1-oxidoreductase beta subunit
VFAVIARCPVLGGQARTVDDTAARAIAGVLDVVALPYAKPPYLFQALGGVAVVARDTWSALRGREALNIEWDVGTNGSYDSAE